MTPGSEFTEGNVEAEIGQPGGLATLDGTGHHTLSQVPLSVVSDTGLDAASPISATSGNRHRGLRDFPSVTDFGASMTARKITDAIIASTSGNAVVSSATANFAAADINSYVQVVGAGTSSLPLVAKITAVGVSGGSTTATLNAAATATVSGANATIGPDSRAALYNAVQAATALILATGAPQSLIIPNGALFLATSSTVFPITSYPSVGAFDNARIGVPLPVGLTQMLTIKGLGRGASKILLSDAARCAFFINQQADYDKFDYVTFEDFDVDNNYSTGLCHTLIGNMVAYSTAQYRLNVGYNVAARRIRCYNTPLDATQAVTSKGLVWFVGATPADQETTQCSIGSVTVEDWETDTQQGVVVASNVGHIPNFFYDRQYARRGTHTPNGGTIPSATLQQNSVRFVGTGFGNYAEINGLESTAVGDNVVELGAVQRSWQKNVHGVNPFLSAHLFRNSQAPPDPLTQKHVIEDSDIALTSAFNAASPTGATGHLLSGAVDNNATGTATTTINNNQLTSLTTSAGVFMRGQVLAGTGVRPGTRVVSISGTTVTMSQTASANGSGIAITGVLELGAVELIRPAYKINGVNISLLNRSAINCLGVYVNGVYREVLFHKPTISLIGVIYDLASSVDLAVFVSNLSAPSLGAGSSQSVSVMRVREPTIILDGLTNPGAGTHFLHVFWPAGNGVVDIDGPMVEANNVIATGGFTMCQIGRSGTLDLVRFVGLTRAVSGQSSGANGIVFNSGGTFNQVMLDEIDFRRWTQPSGFDLRFSSAPANIGTLLRLGRKLLFSNGGANSLGGHITVAASTTLTPVVTSVGVTSTAAARTITLPAAAQYPTGPENTLVIFDESNAAATNNITAACAGADTFTDTTTSKAISTNSGALRLYSTGAKWCVV